MKVSSLAPGPGPSQLILLVLWASAVSGPGAGHFPVASKLAAAPGASRERSRPGRGECLTKKQTNQVASPGGDPPGYSPPRYCPSVHTSQRPVPSTVVRLPYSGPGLALAVILPRYSARGTDRTVLGWVHAEYLPTLVKTRMACPLRAERRQTRMLRKVADSEAPDSEAPARPEPAGLRPYRPSPAAAPLGASWHLPCSI